MERNAFTLVTLLQQLNQRLQAAGSTEQIVVIGPSMGGQIARYALAYMEKNNLAHNTRLFISLDSPHNGATIPLGLQHFVDYFVGATEDATSKAALDQLNSPAARELVQHHYSQGTAFAPHPYRTQFMSDLASFGSYPSQLRRVAVANGALDGTGQVDQRGQAILAGQQAFGLEQRGVPKGGLAGTAVRILFPLGLLARQITLASARVYYAPGFGQTQTVLESYYVTKGRHTQEAAGPSNSCGLDGAPGGYRSFFASLADDNSTGVFQKRNVYSLRDKACFIPTLSALGYTPAPANYCQPAGQTLVCTGTTPFDAYYGPTGHNEEHVQLTPGNVEFIRNEILLKTPSASFLVAPLVICKNSSGVTYMVKDECTTSRLGQPALPTTYTWLVGPNLIVVSGQGTATVQIKPVVGFTGTSSIQVVATKVGYLASATLTQNISVGLPSIPRFNASTPINAVCYSGNVNVMFTVGAPQAETTYKFDFVERSSGAVIESISGTTASVRIALFASGGSYNVVSTATSVCGSTTYSQVMNVIACGGGGRGKLMGVYPNPATSLVTFSATNSTQTSLQTAISKPSASAAAQTNSVPTQDVSNRYQIAVYDGQGRLKWQAPMSTSELVWDSSQLPRGLYGIVITAQDGTINRLTISLE